MHRYLLMHHACLAFSAVHCHAHDSKSLGCGNGAVAVEVSMCELACGESDGTHCAAHCEQCVGNGYDAVAVNVAVCHACIAGECNIVDLNAVIAAVYTDVFAVGPFKGVCAVGSCGVGIGCEIGHARAGELLNFGAVCFEAIPVIIVFTAVEIVEGEGVACGHLNSGGEGCGGVADACIVGLCKVTVALGDCFETMGIAGAELERTAFNIQRFNESGVNIDSNGAGCGAEYGTVNHNGAGDGCSARADAVHGRPALVAADGCNGFVGAGPNEFVIVGIVGNAVEGEAAASADIHFKRSFRKAESGDFNGFRIAEEGPFAVNGLFTVGICGVGVNGAYDDGVSIASGIGYAVFILHGLECIRNGCAFHKGAGEGGEVHGEVGNKGYALGVTVNCTAACFNECVSHDAVTAELHAFADAEPYERVADMRTVEMMLNVAAVDPCCAAGVDCPTVAVVFLSDAFVGGEADIGGRTACGAVAVNKNGAVIGECFNDCGARLRRDPG